MDILVVEKLQNGFFFCFVLGIYSKMYFILHLTSNPTKLISTLRQASFPLMPKSLFIISTFHEEI